MKLTGQTKIDFENWYLSSEVPVLYPHIVNFYGLPDALQWGVVQDFADSVGYYFDIEKRFNEDGYVCFGNHNFEKETNTRQEARNAAIEKFNDIYQSGFCY
jgi:hypothetical protein